MYPFLSAAATNAEAVDEAERVAGTTITAAAAEVVAATDAGVLLLRTEAGGTTGRAPDPTLPVSKMFLSHDLTVKSSSVVLPIVNTRPALIC